MSCVSDDIVKAKEYVKKQFDVTSTIDTSTINFNMYLMGVKLPFNTILLESMIGFDLAYNERQRRHYLVNGGFFWKGLPTRSQIFEIVKIAEEFRENIETFYRQHIDINDINSMPFPQDSQTEEITDLNEESFLDFIGMGLHITLTPTYLIQLASYAERMRSTRKLCLGIGIGAGIALLVGGSLIYNKISESNVKPISGGNRSGVYDKDEEYDDEYIPGVLFSDLDDSTPSFVEITGE